LSKTLQLSNIAPASVTQQTHFNYI